MTTLDSGAPDGGEVLRPAIARPDLDAKGSDSAPRQLPDGIIIAGLGAVSVVVWGGGIGLLVTHVFG